MLQSENNRSIFIGTKASVFLLPTLLGSVIAVLIPLLVVTLFTFIRWDFIGAVSWVGFDNFAKVLNDEGFQKSLLGTLTISFLATTLQLSLGTITGYLLAEWRGRSRALAGIYLLPWFAAPIAIGAVWNWILAPGVGWLQLTFGIASPLTNSALAPLAIALVSAWMGFGYTAIFVAAGIRAIPRSTIDAARVDGATTLRRFWSIQLPQMNRLMMFLVITTSLQTLGTFDLVFVLTGGGPLGATDVATLHIVNSALNQFDVGESSVMATIFTFLELAIIGIQMLVYKRLTRKINA